MHEKLIDLKQKIDELETESFLVQTKFKYTDNKTKDAVKDYDYTDKERYTLSLDDIKIINDKDQLEKYAGYDIFNQQVDEKFKNKYLENKDYIVLLKNHQNITTFNPNQYDKKDDLIIFKDQTIIQVRDEIKKLIKDLKIEYVKKENKFKEEKKNYKEKYNEEWSEY